MKTAKGYLFFVLILTGLLLFSGFICFANGDAQAGDKVGKLTLISFTSDVNPMLVEQDRIIEEELAKLGIDMEIKTLEYKTMIARELTVPHEWNFATTWWTGAPHRLDPDYFLWGTYHSKPEASFNVPRYENPKVDELLEQETATYDLEERKELVNKAQALIHKDCPDVVTLYPDMINAYRTDNFDNPEPAKGEGYASFWNMLNIEPKKQDVLRVAYPGRLNSLNPFAPNIMIVEFRALRLIYDRLYVLGKDLKPTPWLATDSKVVDDTTVEIDIRKGHKFHDGETLSASDVAFTINYVKEWNAPYYASSLEYIKNAKVMDKDTIRLNFTKPYAAYKGYFLTRLPILPEHIWNKVPEKVDVDKPTNWKPEKWIGSGPYEFASWSQGEKLVLKANKDHFHPPNVKALVRVNYNNLNGIVRAIEANEIDLILTHLKELEAGRLEKNPNIKVGRFPNFGYYSFYMDNKKKPTSDISFRKAVAHAIPKERIIKEVFSGNATPGAGTVLAPANVRWHNSNIEPYEYNLDRARTLLKEAGYWWDDKGNLHYPPEQN